MKPFIISILVLLLMLTGNAQIRMRADRMPAPDLALQPLFIVDSIITDYKSLLLDADKIESIDVLKDSATRVAYGESARNGVIIIRTKKGTDILTLNEILDQFHIAPEDRNLRVCIDNMLVKDNSKIIADKTNIASVQVVTDICWISPMEAGPEERYINIATRKPAKTVF